MNDFLEKMKTTRLLASIGIVCIFLGTILPYAKINFWGYVGSVQLFKHFEGIIMLIVAIINFVFIFKDIVQNYIPKLFESGVVKNIADLGSSKISLISTGILVILAVILHMRLDFSIAHFALGAFVLYFGMICLGAYGIMHKQND